MKKLKNIQRKIKMHSKNQFQIEMVTLSSKEYNYFNLRVAPAENRIVIIIIAIVTKII